MKNIQKTEKKIKTHWHKEVEITYKNFYFLLEKFGDLLYEPLKNKFNLEAYANKLLTNSEILYAFSENDEVIGLLAVYANDHIKKSAYIPIIAIQPLYQGHGVGKLMLKETVALVTNQGFLSINLNVSAHNLAAQKLYSQFGFEIESKTDNNIEMKLKIRN